MQTLVLTPDEAIFREHLEQGSFQSGVDRGRWRLVQVQWPHAIIAVAAGERVDAPHEYVFRFDCRNYPQDAPTAQPWNETLDQPLAHHLWPTGRSRVPLAFNPKWQQGKCLYLPCDRIAMVGHEGWRTQHPSLIWSPSGDITQYLKVVYDLLNSSDYTGNRRT